MLTVEELCAVDMVEISNSKSNLAREGQEREGHSDTLMGRPTSVMSGHHQADIM